MCSFDENICIAVRNNYGSMPQLGHECCYPQDDRLGATTQAECAAAIDDQGTMIVKYCTYIGGNRPIGGVDLDITV